jgi:hypothetical protein
MSHSQEQHDPNGCFVCQFRKGAALAAGVIAALVVFAVAIVILVVAVVATVWAYYHIPSFDSLPQRWQQAYYLAYFLGLGLLAAWVLFLWAILTFVKLREWAQRVRLCAESVADAIMNTRPMRWSEQRRRAYEDRNNQRATRKAARRLEAGNPSGSTSKPS